MAVMAVDPPLREPTPSGFVSLREALLFALRKRIGRGLEVEGREQHRTLPATPPHPFFGVSAQSTRIRVPF